MVPHVLKFVRFARIKFQDGIRTFAFCLFPNSWYIGCFVGLRSSTSSQMADCHFAALSYRLLSSSRESLSRAGGSDRRSSHPLCPPGNPTASVSDKMVACTPFKWNVHRLQQMPQISCHSANISASSAKNYGLSEFWLGSHWGQYLNLFTILRILYPLYNFKFWNTRRNLLLASRVGIVHEHWF
jgi:hypothetical protein